MSHHPPLDSPGAATRGRDADERAALRVARTAMPTTLPPDYDPRLTSLRAAAEPAEAEMILAPLVAWFAERYESLDPANPSSLDVRHLIDRLALAERDAFASAVLDPEGTLPMAGVERTVRSTVTGAFNSDTLTALARNGYRRARWVAHIDPVTRDDHLAANGQTRPLGSAFTVGMDRLMFPGDPSGSLAQTANCRCVLVGVA